MLNESVELLIVVLIYIFSVMGIILNTLLLVILHRIKSTRKSYFALIKSLTVADLLFSSIGIAAILFLSVFDLFDYFLLVILVHLILLVMEHYVAIIKPLHYYNWAKCRYISLRLVLGWITPILLLIPTRFLPVKMFKVTGWYEGEVGIGMEEMIRVPLIFTCFIGMLIVNTYMYIAVRKQQRLDDVQNQHAKHNHKALVITILNVASFFIFWFPVAITEMYALLRDPVDLDEYNFNRSLKELTPYLVIMNSVCDPLIYAIRLQEVQKMWRQTFCCCCRRSPVDKIEQSQMERQKEVKTESTALSSTTSK